MQTEVIITPIENTKRASVTGEAAVGETVQFRLKGCATEFAHLRLRIRVGRIDAAVFPRPDASPDDMWRIDGNDAVCELSLATRELRLASVSRRSVRCEAIVDDGGEDTMLCSVPLVLKVWRRGLAPLPEPSGPANDWKARCDAIDEALSNESQHRVAGDEDLSERIDNIVVPDPPVSSVNGKTGAVVLASSDIAGASGSTVAQEISQVGQVASGAAQTASEKYTKPSGGIPATDLASTVQSALSDARTPLQHAASHKTGGSDALAPSDIGAASVADATLNGRGPNHDGFSEWTVVPPTYQGSQLSPRWNAESRFWELYNEFGTSLVTPDMEHGEDALELAWDDGEPLVFSASRTALPGYVLGNQTEKPLADADAVPAPSSATPAMDGTASSGLSAAYARGDHVHPHDTTKQDALSSAQLANIADVPNKADATTLWDYLPLDGSSAMTGLLKIYNSTASIWMGPSAASGQGTGMMHGAILRRESTSDPTYVMTIPQKDGTALLDVDANMLPVASPTVSSGAFALAPETAVYRVAASLSGTAATIPTPDATAIPNQSAYFCFEMEVSVDSTATTLSGPTGWTWLDGGELPTDATDFAGKVLHIACRLDCAQGARGVVANCWWAEEVSA